MSFTFVDSYKKNMKQLSVVARAPIIVGTKVLQPPPQGVRVSDSFWRKYGCYLNCGACCHAVTLDFLPFEWDRFMSFYPQHEHFGQERIINVNGVERPIMSILTDAPQVVRDIEWCQFLDPANGGCTIHEENPLSCRMELIKVRQIKDRGYIMKGPYGRAWLMSRITDGGEVLCDFPEFDPIQFYQNDLPRLRQMSVWASYFSIDTYLPEIIDLMQLCVESQRLEEINLP